MKKAARSGFCLLLNVLFPLFQPVIHHFRPIDFLALVYPGHDSDITSYVPFKWVRRVVPAIFLVGFFVRGGGLRGITVATPFSDEEMERDPDLNVAIMERLGRFAQNVGSKSVAIVGRMPSIMIRHGVPIESTVIRGERGTLFTITSAIETVMERENLPSGARIGILGVGFIGKRLIRLLKERGYSVSGVDRKTDLRASDSKCKIILGGDVQSLGECDMVVVLTPKGSDINDVIPCLKQRIIVIDDTHPPIPSESIRSIREKGGKVYKAVVVLGEMRSFPRWPGYDGKWLPGCIVEAIVTSKRGFGFPSQEAFDETARKIGFRPIVVELTSQEPDSHHHGDPSR